MTTYGYARVSTRGQQRDGNSIEAQREQLRSVGCSVIVEEAYTGTTTHRPKFEQLCEQLRDGDTLVVTKLDRFARSTVEGCQTVRDLISRGVTVRVLNMGTLDDTPVGHMMVSVMFAMAEFERDMIVQRTMEGKAQAKARDPSWHPGPDRTEYDMDLVRRHMALVSARKESAREAQAAVGCARTKWYELRKEIRMTDAREFYQRQVRPTLGDFEGDYDADLLMDRLSEEGLVEFDPTDGYRWTEANEEDAASGHERYWDIVRGCELS